MPQSLVVVKGTIKSRIKQMHVSQERNEQYQMKYNFHL